MKISQVLKQTAILYSPKLVSWAVGYLALTSVLKLAGPTAYADYVLFNSFWFFLAIFSGSVMGASSQKILAEGNYQQESYSRFVAALKTAGYAALIMGIIGLLLVWPVGQYIIQNELMTSYLHLGLLLFLGTSLQNFLRYALRSLQMFKLLALMDSLESLLRNLFWLGAVMAIGFSSLISGATAAIVIASGLCLFLVFRSLNKREMQPTSLNTRHAILQVAPAFVTVFVCNYVLFSLPPLIINYFQSKEIVGAYAAIYRAMDMINGPVNTLGAVLAPMISGAVLQSTGGVHKILHRSAQVTILTLPLIAGVFINRDIAINLLGLSKIDGATTTLAIFCFFILFCGISDLFGAYSDYLGYTKKRSKVMIGFCIAYTLTLCATAKYGNIQHIALGSTVIFGLMVYCYLALIAENHSWGFVKSNFGLFAITVLSLAAAILSAEYVHHPLTETSFHPNFIEFARRSCVFTIVFLIPFCVGLKIKTGRWFKL